jgi:uncharacterized protein YbjT (DUF2867 family)
MERRIAIVGGLGKTGRRVFDRLTARGIPAFAASRSSRPGFDWLDRSTWPLALRGATAAYVTYQPDLGIERAADDIGTLAAVAAEAGVEHVVLLSGRGEARARRAEERLRRAPLDHTILRASRLAQDFSEGAFLEGILAGDLALPAGEVREPFVSADDIADAAVEALCDPVHVGRTYEITGPRSLRFAEAVAEIAAASGRDVRYRPVPTQEFLSTLRKAGKPEDLVWLMEDLFTHTLDGRNETVTPDVERILGRRAVDFTDYARRAGQQGAWAA